jgi:heat shock protein HslJ
VGISVVGVSLLLTAGCSADAASSGFPDSGVYLSTAESTFPLVAGTSVRMELTEGRLSATAGCNTLSGNYSLKAQTLSVPVLASTRIGCPDELAAQDQRLEQLLTSAPTVAVDPLGFTLTGADATTLVMTQSSASPAVT